MPTTCPYPKPARSSPYPHILLPEDTSTKIQITLPSTPESPKWSLSLRFPQHNPVYASLPHTRYMPSPSNSSRFFTQTISGEEYRSFSSSLWSFLQSSVDYRYSKRRVIAERTSQRTFPNFTTFIIS
jgi:hypothetical protein